MPGITVIAKAKARAGKESELERAVRAVVAPTHAEDGCLKYALHRAADDPLLFTIVERWTSKEALDGHLSSKHVGELFSKLAALVEAPPEIRIFESLREGDPAKGLL